LVLNISYLVMVRVTGGEAPGCSSLAPKIGPLGLVNT
jgi:ribosomal protein L11